MGSNGADERFNNAVGTLDTDKHRGTALLIDDEELVRASVKLLLENLGWLVFDVGSRAEALSVLASEPSVSLVVCDVRLGDEQGFEVINALQSAGLESFPFCTLQDMRVGSIKDCNTMNIFWSSPFRKQ